MKLYTRSPHVHSLCLKLFFWGELELAQQETADRWIHINDRICDINALTGNQSFLNANKGGNTLCISPYYRMAYHIAKKRPLQNQSLFIQPVHAHVSSLPYIIQPHSCDVLILSLVMHMIPEQNWNVFLKDCKQLLKPDGILVCIEYIQPQSRIKRITLDIINAPLRLFLYMLGQFYVKPVPDIADALISAGFSICEKRLFLFDTLQAWYVLHTKE
ncbi:MAG: methyltransferase domain-containing protein [Elusimicrobia bacterium]|nr:methyltransferase domain-containing protein [Elusimicrobiota bacterium]MBD3411754.1 methyltransferase domain-containing protein [Elusimicrobiota bacterium]